MEFRVPQPSVVVLGLVLKRQSGLIWRDTDQCGLTRNSVMITTAFCVDTRKNEVFSKFSYLDRSEISTFVNRQQTSVRKRFRGCF